MQPAPPITSTVSYAEFVDVYQAVAFANCQGRFVDAALDVSWSLHGIVANDAVRIVHERFLLALADWLLSQGLPPFYIWAIERGGTYGLHSHITLSMPAMYDAPFRMFLNTELTRLVAGALMSTDRSSTYRLETFASETSMHQWRRFRYLLKALDPNVDLAGKPTADLARTLARVAKISLQIGGRVEAPRVGVAPELAHAHRADWQRRYGMPDMTIRPDYPPTFNDRFIYWYEEHAESMGLGSPGNIERPQPPRWCST